MWSNSDLNEMWYLAEQKSISSILGRENYHSKVGMVIFSYYEAVVENLFALHNGLLLPNNVSNKKYVIC